MGLWSDFRKWTGAVFGSRKEIVLDPSTHLSEFSEFVPRGFANGLELLNDQSTPMLFIVEELSKHLGVTLHEAAKIAWEIHTRGGALVPLSLWCPPRGPWRALFPRLPVQSGIRWFAALSHSIRARATWKKR